jgi:lysophospholipase L1-like esterase
VRRSTTGALVAAAVISIAACTGTGSATPPPEASNTPASDPPAEAGSGTIGPVAQRRTDTIRLITLGDSYTYGTGTDAPRRDSWPAQLSTAMTQRGDVRVHLRNLAQESSSSEQVLEEQVGQVAGHEPDVVTLQVGVNDIVGSEGSEADWYGDNVSDIFDELLELLPPEHIFAITTPDHTLTEWGQAYGSHDAVVELNETLAQAAAQRDIAVIDIGQVNDLVRGDPSLLVQEDPPVPYPTAKQYAGWVEAIGPYIYDAHLVVEP